MSYSSSPHRSPEPEDKPKPNKIFVTNLDVEVPSGKLQAQLQEKFAKYGKLQSVAVKKSFNNEYSFAFIEYFQGEDASDAVKDLNNTQIFGKRMKVELQDNSRRRKGGNETCFVCGKAGHYARNCRMNRGNSSFILDRHERDRSSSSSRHHKRSRKHRRSSSSESRSRKEKKKRSHKMKKEKHKKRRESKSPS